jgi:FMN phosphatase YigB (HAD superfamily)
MDGSVAVRVPARECTDHRMTELHALVDSGDFDLLSLDVFDTYVFREAPRPSDVFFHVARELRARGAFHDSSSPESFVRERMLAETRARARKPGHEVTLEEIWAEFPRGYFRKGTPQDGLRTELECERGVVRVYEPMRELVERARARGMRVAFVSDTYYSRPHIRQVTGITPDFVVLSDEHACPKLLGLHRVLLERCGVAAERILHVGDSWEADVRGPEQFGMARFHFRRFPAEYEGMLERELPDALSRRAHGVAHPDGGLTSLRSHAMASCDPGHERWGAAVLGPVLAGYGEWLAARCAELGIDTVLCPMREGTTIRRTLEALGSPLRAHEVYVSRFVALKAAILRGTPAEIGRFVSRPTPVQAAKLLGQLGLEPADLPDVDPETRLSPADIRVLVQRIADDTRLRHKVVASSAAARAGLMAHLRPVLPDRGTIAVADLGYKGTIQMGLQEVFDAERVRVKTHGLYLVTGGDVHDTQRTGAAVEGWLAENSQPNALAHTFMRSPKVFEQGMMADCGTTLGHAPDGTPLLDTFHVPPAQREQVAAAQRGAEVFLGHWAAHRRTHGPVDATTMRELCRAIAVRAIARPLPVELELFGRWQHDENFGSAAARSFTTITDMHDWERTHISAYQLASLPYSRVYWPFGVAWGMNDVFGEAVASIFLRSAAPQAFESAQGPRPMVISWSDGTRWADDHCATVEYTPGSHGRCWLRNGITVGDEPVRAVALGFGAAGDLLRITGARVHWRSAAGANETDTFASDALLVHGAERLAPGIFLVTESSAVVLFELAAREGFRGVADIDLFFAVLPGNLDAGEPGAPGRTAPEGHA